MRIKKVINIEDIAYKHIRISRAMKNIGLEKIDNVKTAEKGIEMIEEDEEFILTSIKEIKRTKKHLNLNRVYDYYRRR